MTNAVPDSTLNQFTTFGDLLKYLRRRAGLTQRELSIAVGYSTAQICRLEQNQRLPDLPTLTARFAPELGLDDEPVVVRRLLELASTVRREDAPAAGLPPFKGLLYFDENDNELFFGREALTSRLTTRLFAAAASAAGPRFLAVVGASGSGKSSIMRAGLIPAVRWDPASAGWTIHVLTPTVHPLEALAASVLGEGASRVALAACAEAMSRGPHGLSHALRDAASRNGGAPALIVMDQFEELFTLCRSEAERHACVDNLMTAVSPGAAEAPPLLLVIALRADFYAQCAVYPQLRAALAQNQEYIGSMTAVELRRAIEEPARRGHWEFEPGLVDVLLQDLGADGDRPPEPGALPLLSHALLETWQRRRGHTLTLSGYAASGGVRGAIAETAEAVFHDQLSPQQRDTARAIFLRLTEFGLDETVPDTRRRVRLSELVRQPADAPLVREVLTVLADARLITTEEQTAEVAHEALIREWPTLRLWLAENREGLRLHRQLTETAQEWERTGRDEGLAFRGARLAQALEWAAGSAADMNALEREFLEVSRTLAEREAAEREAQRLRELTAAQQLAAVEQQRADEQGRAARQLRRRALYLAGALVLALIMAGAAIFFGEQARRIAVAAQASERIAFSRELAAAAVSNLDLDPERSVLLALEAVSVTYGVDQSWTAEAENALHRALHASRVELTLRGHTGIVASAAFTPDGARLATAASGQVIVWDAATGRAVMTLDIGADGGHHGIDISPDGAWLAAPGPRGTAAIWDLATGQLVLTLNGHTAWVSEVAFSPDGARLATAGEDRVAKVWDLATGAELFAARHAETVWGVAFSADGTQLATSSQDGLVKLWDAATGRLLHTLAGHRGSVYSVVYDPACPDPLAGAADCLPRVATAGDDGTARIWDASTGALLLTISGHTGLVSGVAFSADGRRLATTSFDGTAKVWDAATGQALLTLPGHTGPVVSAIFSPDCVRAVGALVPPCSTRLATTSFDGTARVWNVSASRELQTLEVAGHTASAHSPDDARLAVGLPDGTVQVWDTAALPATGAWPGPPALVLRNHSEAISSLAFSPDGARLAAASSDHTATVWDAVTGEVLTTLRGHAGAIRAIAFSPDGARLVTAADDYTVRVWTATFGRELISLLVRGGAGALALTSQCYRLPDMAVEVCEPRLATAGENGVAQVWDLTTGQELLSLLGHTEAVLDVAFSPDGQRVATASFDGTARVWDAATGQEVLALAGHTDAVQGIAYSPDGSRLATSSFDGSARVWDAASGQLLQTLLGHTGLVTDVRFTSDGAWLWTDSTDGALRSSLLRIDDLLALARQRVTRAFTTNECQQYLHLERCPGEASPAAETAVADTPAVAATSSSAAGRICELTDVTGVSDAFFNQLAFSGVQDVSARFGWESEVLEPDQNARFPEYLERFIEGDCDLIVTPTAFLLTEAVEAAARAHPDQKVLLLDLTLEPPLENVWGQVYAVDQAAFLAGYVAASATQTGKVAAFGGVATPSVIDFMNGFALGVAYYNERNGAQVEVLGWDVAQQNGLFVGNFDNIDDGRRIGEQLLADGADIILPVAGIVGLGTAVAVQEHGAAYIIGVDTDWTVTFPELAGVVLTSIEKKLDVSVVRTVEAIVAGGFTGGAHVGTLETGEVGLAPFHQLDSLVSDEVKADLEDIIAGIIQGTIATRP